MDGIKTTTMQGQRIESPFAAGGGLVAAWPQPGEYYFMPEQGWCACTPNGHLANLSQHTVTEHKDGTITVSPSIRVTSGAPDICAWHGYLERGVWREC